MNEGPPPAAPPPPPGMPGEAKPPQVTAAGVIEIVLGILILLLTVAFAVVAAGEDALGEGLVIVVLLLQTVQGILDLTAGTLVLRLRPAGRVLAIVMAAVGAAFAALTLAQGQVTGGQIVLVLIGITLRVLVIVFLNSAQARTAFATPRT